MENFYGDLAREYHNAGMLKVASEQRGTGGLTMEEYFAPDDLLKVASSIDSSMSNAQDEEFSNNPGVAEQGPGKVDTVPESEKAEQEDEARDQAKAQENMVEKEVEDQIASETAQKEKLVSNAIGSPEELIALAEEDDDDEKDEEDEDKKDKEEEEEKTEEEKLAEAIYYDAIEEKLANLVTLDEYIYSNLPFEKIASQEFAVRLAHDLSDKAEKLAYAGDYSAIQAADQLLEKVACIL